MIIMNVDAQLEMPQLNGQVMLTERVASHISNATLPHESATALEEMSALDFYNLYDDLVENYPDQLSSYLWGMDDSGNPLKYYVLDPSKGMQLLPTHFLTSGVHGNEKTAQYSGYLKVKDLLETGTEGVRFIILPVCNPYGTTHNTRKNGNDVNLNRNFPVNWKATDESGSTPLDQPETRFMIDIFTTYSEHLPQNKVVVTDLHTFIYRPEDHKVMWSIVTTTDVKQQVLRAEKRIYTEISERYPTLTEDHPTQKFHLVNTPLSPTFIHYMKNLGYNGVICEAPNYITSTEERYSQAAFDINYLIVSQYVDDVMTLLE